MRKRFVYVLSILLLLFFFQLILSYETKVTEIDDSVLAETEDPDLSELREELISSVFSTIDFPVFADSVYIVQSKNFIGSDTVTYLVPYTVVYMEDVWTAGSFRWQISFHVVAFVREGGVLKKVDRFRVKSLELDMEGDQNTALINLSYSNKVSNNLNAPLGDFDGKDLEECCVEIRVGTMDSSQSHNAECYASLQWSGTISLKTNSLIPQSIPFELNAVNSYINNCTYCSPEEDIPPA